MRTFYHVTKTENLPNIFKNGLIPMIGDASMDLGENEERVYLFPTLEDMECALMNWFGAWYEEQFGEDVEICSLIITLPDTFPIEEGEVEYECYSYQTIAPEYIKFFKNE